MKSCKICQKNEQKILFFGYLTDETHKNRFSTKMQELLYTNRYLHF